MGEASPLERARRAAAAEREPPAHLSPAAEVAIRLLPGNDRCADCKALFPQWAGVSFGVLLCLACAGRHRALGVRTSVVRSLAMDAWTPAQQRQLEAGGNAKWLAVCAATATSELPTADKYCSSIAALYRARLSAVASDATDPLTATQFLSTLTSVTAPVRYPSSLKSPNASSIQTPLSSPDSTEQTPLGDEVLCIKCTTCQVSIPVDHLNEHSTNCVVNASSTVIWRQYECELGSPNAPLGFSLTKTNGGFAEVSRVTPGGAAERANVLVGSFVVGLNDRNTSAFDEVVHLVRTLSKPIRFQFAFRPSVFAKRQISTISSVPEPVSVDVSLTFEDVELGCSFEADELGCVVSRVDKDGAAKKMGVLVGSKVIAVNGRRFLPPAEVLREVSSSHRPLHIKLHRVEGLMLGWRR